MCQGTHPRRAHCPSADLARERTNRRKESKKTLADKVYDALERWADNQGRPVANLATYLVEKAIEQAKAEGKITAPSPKGES